MKMGEKLPNTSSDHVALPLLDGGGDGGGGGGGGISFWLVDVEEGKNQILFSLPMILSNVFCYLIPLVSVMFAGHLGQLQLAAATLANSWCFVTGFAFMIGLSGALETLCGQSFGAKSYKMLGIYMQASCITSFLFSTIIGSLWFYTEHTLIFLHQDPEISRTAGVYMKFLIPGLFAYGFQQNILRFLQTQSEVMPLIVLLGVPLCAHVGVSYALVHCTSLGFKGAPIAASISLWISTIVLVVYVIFSKQFKHTWSGFTFESFHHVLTNMKLALSSAAMVCLEDCAFELLVLMAGMMPNRGLTTSLIALCVNTEAIAFMGTYGLSATVSTRVSNELGAGNPDKAKKATVMTVKLSLLLAIVIVLALSFGNNIWAGCYSDSAPIMEAFASMTPLLAISITLDAIQGILSGVARGCGWQDLAVIANLATFYCIGMPAAAILGFKFKLYAKGLWIGLICGLSCHACALLLITLSKKWTRLDMLDDGGEQNSELVNPDYQTTTT